MKKVLLLTFIAAISQFAMAQPQLPSKPLKKFLKLTMARTEDDDFPGTRGASVAWNPLTKKYYAAMAGNAAYPLCIFDATGKRLSSDDLSTEADVRGLWFNPLKKTIQGNCYNEFGWFSYELDAKGFVTDNEFILEGMNQPDAQSVGAYIPGKNKIAFVNAGQVYYYNMKDGVPDDPFTIHWGRTSKDGVDETADETETPEAYNTTTVVYTGIKNAELGFLNTIDMQIELYSMTTGFMTQTLKLPDTAPVNSTFNFAYCNGTYWLFSMEERTWTGYR